MRQFRESLPPQAKYLLEQIENGTAGIYSWEDKDAKLELNPSAERRLCDDDGKAYTKEQFQEFFGGLEEWDRAKPVPADFVNVHKDDDTEIVGDDPSEKDAMLPRDDDTKSDQQPEGETPI